MKASSVVIAAFATVLLVVSGLWAEGPASAPASTPASAASHHVGFYLVTAPESVKQAQGTPLEKLTLAAEPFLSENDIRRYEWPSHAIHLRPGAADRTLLFPGRPSAASFVVVADGQRIYLGVLQEPMPYEGCPVPIIYIESPGVMIHTQDRIRINPSEPNRSPRPDPRNDIRLIEALQPLGLLDDAYGVAANALAVAHGTGSATQATHQVGFYFVTSPETLDRDGRIRMEDLALEAQPFISQDDLAAYDWPSHTMTLRKGAGGRYSSHNGAPPMLFVVVVDGRRIYLGEMLQSNSQGSPRMPTIRYQMSSFIKIISSEQATPGVPDPRNDASLKQALGSLGLISNDNATPANSQPALPPASAPLERAGAEPPVGTLIPVAVTDEYTGECAVSTNNMPPGRAWAVAPPDSGVVNPRAVIAKLTGAGKEWSAALDSRLPGDQEVNVVRLDVTGKNRFQNAQVLPLRRREPSGYAIGPVAVDLEVDGRMIPVMVRGTYERMGSIPDGRGGEVPIANVYRDLKLRLSTAMAGACQFGEKVYSVRVADANGNLVLGEPVQLDGYVGGRLRVVKPGDEVMIFSKEGGLPLSTAPLGHPILVEGVWYDLKVGPDGSTMAATARTEPTGTVVMNADKWSALLIRNKEAYDISGGREGVQVPAGEYDIASYQQTNTQDNTVIELSQVESKPETRRIKVEAGQTLALKIGAPLQATPKSKIGPGREGTRWLRTSVVLRDVGGRNVALDYSWQSEILNVVVRDETGKELSRGPLMPTFSGPRGGMGYVWQLPRETKGTLTVELDSAKFPFKVECSAENVEVPEHAQEPPAGQGPPIKARPLPATRPTDQD